MRPLILLLFAVTLAAPPALAAVCETAPAARSARPHWRVDHYVYDASLHKDWEVLVDCDHPSAPARMRLAPNAPSLLAVEARKATMHEARIPSPAAPVEIKAGAAVEVLNGPNAPATICLSGTAMQSAYRGQTIRVRLSANGHFVNVLVSGPHAVELAAASKPFWRQP
jgi:hypothetical protein